MVLEQLIANGIIAGGIYALIAVGFSMTYSLLRFLNMAHGAMFVVGAYIAYFLFSMGLPLPAAFVPAIIGAAVIGVLMNFVVYRPLRDKKSSSLILLLSSIALFILIENVVIALFGAEVKTIRTITQGIDIFGAIITQTQILIIIVSLLTLLATEMFLSRTRTGKAMRATADNKEVAQVIGIDVERITTYMFALGSALAAGAGILVGMEQNLEPTMGFNAVIKGFTSSVIGGLGSLKGAVAGAFLLGLVENIGIWFLPSGYKDAIAFVVLVAFLLFRPQGIFGREET